MTKAAAVQTKNNLSRDVIQWGKFAWLEMGHFVEDGLSKNDSVKQHGDVHLACRSGVEIAGKMAGLCLIDLRGDCAAVVSKRRF